MRSSKNKKPALPQGPDHSIPVHVVFRSTTPEGEFEGSLTDAIVHRSKLIAESASGTPTRLASKKAARAAIVAKYTGAFFFNGAGGTLASAGKGGPEVAFLGDL